MINYEPLSTILNIIIEHHQKLLTIINHDQTLLTIIKHHQPSSSVFPMAFGCFFRSDEEPIDRVGAGHLGRPQRHRADGDAQPGDWPGDFLHTLW